MKLEFLDDISDGGKFSGIVTDKLIRLFDFDTKEAKELINQIEDKIIKKGEKLIVNDLFFIASLNCTLCLNLAEIDTGITTQNNYNFDCNLTKEAYQDMIKFIEPFSEDLGGYQWLCDSDSDIEFLLSPNGGW